LPQPVFHGLAHDRSILRWTAGQRIGAGHVAAERRTADRHHEQAILLTDGRNEHERPEDLARESAERYGWPAGFLARYFEKLRYHFGPREREGLMKFYELAHEAGELDTVPELRFADMAEVK